MKLAEMPAWAGHFLFKSTILVGLNCAVSSSIALPAVSVRTQLSGQVAQFQSPTSPQAEVFAEANRLFQQGIAQYQTSQFEAALRTWQQALTLYRELNDRQRIGNTLNNIGITYEALGDYSKAIEYQQQRIALAREINDRLGEGQSLNNLGIAVSALGNYPKAIEYYQQSLSIAREINDRQGEGQSLGNLANAYYRLGDYPKSIQYQEESLAIARTVKNRSGEATTLGNIGATYYALGDYPKSIEYQQQSLAIAREINNRRSESLSLGNIANAFLRLGDYQKAIEYQQQKLAITRDIKDRSGEGQSLGDLGTIYSILGQYPQAIEYQQQSLVIARAIKDRLGEGQSLGNLGATFFDLGDYQQAIQYQEQRLAIAQEMKNPLGEWNALNNLGNAYQALGDYLRAIECYQQSLKLARTIQDRLGEGNILGNIGNTYFRLGNYQKAAEYHQQSLVILKDIKNRIGEGLVLGNLGNTYAALGDYPKAIDYYRQSLSLAGEIKNQLGEALFLNSLGLVLFRTGNLSEAETTLMRSIEKYEFLRQGLRNTQKVSIADTQRNPYNNLQQVLIAQNRLASALEIAERGRARAFAELLAQRTQGTESQLPPPISIAAIQQIAREQRATLVEYANLYNEQLFIWVVKPTGEVAFRQVDLQPLKQHKTSLNTLIAAARCLGKTSCEEAIASRGSQAPVFVDNAWPTDRTTVQPATQNEYLQKLHQLLIAPIADLLPTNPNDPVVFIPQDRLFLLPFAALQDQQGQYLIEKHTIAIAPSIQVLDLTRKQRKDRSPLNFTKDNMLLVGNPTMPTVTYKPGESGIPLISLAGAEKEAKAIAELLQVPALLGSQATKTAVLKRMPTARVIHLATHGLLDDLSGFGVPGAIALAPSSSKPNDGLLTANEMLDPGFKLQAELVVLSGCDTGRGKITGDGVIGLSRSLMTAGVPSIVVSLWKVPDAPTADLMTEFYRNLKQGQNKAQALRQAMLTTKQRHSDLTTWAAFTLIGEAN